MRRPKLHLSASRETLRDAAPDAIRQAFPAPSQHQTCVLASRTLGVSPDTIDRLLTGCTAHPDLLLLLHIARLAEARTGQVSPIAHLVAAILGATP